MHIFLKAARRPGSNVNEQFSCDTGAGKIYCGSSNFPLNERTAALFQNGDKILDVAHRAGSWPEMASFRELIRQLGGQAANLFQHEVDECNLTAPPSPQTVAGDSVLLGCSPTRSTLMRPRRSHRKSPTLMPSRERISTRMRTWFRWTPSLPRRFSVRNLFGLWRFRMRTTRRAPRSSRLCISLSTRCSGLGGAKYLRRRSPTLVP